jgi:catechol 2,3-dioxygenase-like lactoylglutathione lyase family enzyme
MSEMTVGSGWPELGVVQIGLNTIDLPATIRLYSELCGFANGGANAFWGPPSAIQGLGPETRGILWWLVGRQKFFQLELFQHTVPRPRLLPGDWRPSDHGWVRFGVALRNFDRALGVLQTWDIQPLAPAATRDGLRRIAFRDPFVGVVVELFEDGPSIPGGIRRAAFELEPAVVYATSSVADLDSAREFYQNVLGLQIEPRDLLHTRADEALWGLPGADVEGFVARSGQVFVEVVSYKQPQGRPQPEDHCIADQGIMNIALGARDIACIRAIVRAARQAGIRTGQEFGAGDLLSLFLLDPGREVELIALPEKWDAATGFVPGAPFFGTWSLSSAQS